MNKINKIATILEKATIVFGVFSAITIGLKWAQDKIPNNHGFRIMDSYSGQMLSDLLPNMSIMQRTFGLIADGIGLMIFVYGLYTFIIVLRCFKQHDYFSAHVITLLNKLSKIALAWTIYTPINGMAMSLVTSLHKGVGNRVISASIGSSDITNIFIFGIFVLLTSVMREGHTLKKEVDATI